MKIFTRRTLLTVVSFILVLTTQGVASAPVLPNPILYFLGPEYVEISGKQMIRYHYDVLNKDLYPDDMFAQVTKPAALRRQHPSCPYVGGSLRSSGKTVEWLLRSGKISGPQQDMVCFGSGQDTAELYLYRA